MDGAPLETTSQHQKNPPENKERKIEEDGESEYDSADESYSDHHKKSGSDTDGSLGPERESGDGQESAPAKKVDDDEDKKNPQYIPKRGTFYEHDDRTAEDEKEAVEVDAEKAEKEAKKKVWQDKKERWGHDRFNDTEQAPKSRSELVAIYGYDIRNEDGPPRARRRRRYGRGPNKYTRNWEDEDAYGKPPPVKPNKKPIQRKPDRRNEEYPSLPRENRRQEPESDRSSGKEEPIAERPREPARSINAPSSSSQNSGPVASSREQQEYVNKNPQPRVGSGRVVKPKREIQDSDYRGFTSKTRQIRNYKTEQKIVPRTAQKSDDFVQTQNFTNRNNVQNLEADLGKLSIESGQSSKHQGNKYQGRQGSVPPRLQSEQKGSKRYSSIRQRSLPEASTPPFNQHSNYYPNGNAVVPGVMQIKADAFLVKDFNQQAHLNHPSTAQIPPPTLPPIAQVPVTATPILQAAPQFGPPFPQAPPPFLQPNVAPPPFIPQQTPQLINYVPGQPQFTQGFQGFQQPFSPVQAQPESMYQPSTGITYYSTDQQISQRAVLQKRPKAAIPIVAPPISDNKKPNAKTEEDGEMSEQIIENSNFNKSDSIPQ